MPYKEGTGWRGTVPRWMGKPYTKRFETKKAAKEWEQKRKEEAKAIPTPMASLLKASTEYLTYCEAQYSRSTFTDKRKALKELMQAVGNIPIDQIESNVILHKIILHKKTPNLSNKRRKDLNAFFEHCRNFHGLTRSPMAMIERLPIQRIPQPVPTEEEFLKLLMVADRHDRNLLIVCAGTGGRRSEILRLTWRDDIDWKEKTIRLGNRKNRLREMRYRYIEFGENKVIEDALLDQYKTRLKDSDYVFQNRAVWRDKKGKIVRKHPNYGDRYTARRKLMKGLCKRAKIEKKIGFHALRRFFGSLLIEQGEKLTTVQELLGHAQVSTTDRYVRKLKDDKKRAVGKLKLK